MKEHTCKEIDYCICSSQALEPDEQCPKHGGGVWPPRCMYCGRFMKWKTKTESDRMSIFDPEAIREMEENCGWPCNWFIVVTRKETVDGQEYDIIQHVVAYENQPGQDDVNALYDELRTDESFGMMEFVDELEFYVESKKSTQDKNFATLVGYSE